MICLFTHCSNLINNTYWENYCILSKTVGYGGGDPISTIYNIRYFNKNKNCHMSRNCFDLAVSWHGLVLARDDSVRGQKARYIVSVAHTSTLLIGYDMSYKSTATKWHPTLYRLHSTNISPVSILHRHMSLPTHHTSVTTYVLNWLLTSVFPTHP